MEEEEKNNLNRMAAAKADFVSQTLRQIEEDTKLAHKWGTMILNGVNAPTDEKILDSTNNGDELKAGAINMYVCITDSHTESGSGTDITSTDGANKLDCCCQDNAEKNNKCPQGEKDTCCHEYGSWFYPGKYTTTDGDANSEYVYPNADSSGSVTTGLSKRTWNKAANKWNEQTEVAAVEVDNWAALNDKQLGYDNKGVPTNEALTQFSLFSTAHRALMHDRFGHDLTVGTYFGSETGVMRNYPYSFCNHYANPAQSVVDSTDTPCYNMIGNKCPSKSGMCSNKQDCCWYDPRCRGWYVLGKCDRDMHSDDAERWNEFEMNGCKGNVEDNGKVFWTPAYLSTTGNYELTAVSPLYDVDGNLLGVFGNDVTVAAVTNAINSFDMPLSDSGYVYAVDMEGAALIHANYTRLDTDENAHTSITERGHWQVSVEGWSEDEKESWTKNVLDAQIKGSGESSGLVEYDRVGCLAESGMNHNGCRPTDCADSCVEEPTAEELKACLACKYTSREDCEKDDDDGTQVCVSEQDGGPVDEEGNPTDCRPGACRWVEKWWLSWAQSEVGGYVVAATVPHADIQKPAALVTEIINGGIAAAIIVFVVIGFLIITIVFLVARAFSIRVAYPVQELASLCKDIANGELDGEVDADAAASADVGNLQEAFKGMIVGLRFGKEEYHKGNITKSERCFKDALDLYTRLENPRGIGVSQNNLASVYMHTGKMTEAIRLYRESIQIADKMQREAGEGKVDADGEVLVEADEQRQSKYQKAMSDRQGNLAALYFEMKEFKKAETLLMEALAIDKNIENYIGFAIKSGTLGQVYLKTEQFGQATDAFKQADDLISDETVQEFMAQNAGIAAIEFTVARQHVMVNMGDLAKATGRQAEAHKRYVETLESFARCDLGVQRRCLKGLSGLYGEDNQPKVKEAIDHIMKDLFGASGGHQGPRDIALILDYSGSMSGGKHRAAMRNLKGIFDKHIGEDDSVMFVHFSSNVTVNFSLTRKGGNEDMIHQSFDRLQMPGGSTAFYDAVDEARKAMALSKNKSNQQWIIALTDGDDNRSALTLSQCKDRITNSTIDGLVVLAVGNDVASAPALAELARCSPKGQLVRAGAGQDDIDAAFEQVVKMIEVNVVLETYD